MQHVPRVKICGIADLEDARLAVGLGADALGFLVGLRYEASDELTPDAAKVLISELPPFVNSVLVTHLTDPAAVLDLCRQVGPQVVQLHGEFHAEDIPLLREAYPHLKIIKAVHVEGEHSLEAASEAARNADAILLDTRVGDRIGGTGTTHDWSLSLRIREALAGYPVILAGGLTPENVALSIQTVGPYGVDVNSGVKAGPVHKSPDLMRRFIVNARLALTEHGRFEESPAIGAPAPRSLG